MENTVNDKPQFGSVLKQARKSQKLSVEDVAKQLNLPVARIQEIEQEELLSEFSVAFYRGYVRAYATFLKIDPNTVLELFNETVKADIEISSNQRLRSFSSARKETNTGSKLFKWFSFIFIIAVLLIVGWGLKERFTSADDGALLGEDGLVPMTSFMDSDNEDEDMDDSSATSSDITTTTDLTAQQGSSLSINDDVDVAETDADDTQPKKQTVEQLKQRLESTDNLSSDINAKSTSDISDTGAVEASGSYDSGFNDSASDDTSLSQASSTNDVATDDVAASSSDEASGVNAAVELEQLVFAFVGECWVDIVDATGERLAYGIKNNGKVMTLRGVPPFDITLGDPSVVRLQHEQQTIDLSHYRAGQTAKITIE